MKIYKDYYKKIEEYMDGLTKNITIANEEELESFLEALEKVDFDSHLTNLAEKVFSTSILLAEYPYILPLEIYRHAMKYRVNINICKSFYQYISDNGWDEESIIIKGMLCEKDLQGIKEFCIKHTFSDRENSYFMERPIWNGKNYEDVLKKYGVPWKEGFDF